MKRGKNQTAPHQAHSSNPARTPASWVRRRGVVLAAAILFSTLALRLWFINVPRVSAANSTGGAPWDFPDCQNDPFGDSGNNASGSCSTCSGSSSPNFAPGASATTIPVGAIGLPTWGVSEPMLAVWLRDNPCSYQPSHGEPISFKLFYKSNPDSTLQGEISAAAVATPGKNWFSPWIAYMPLISGTSDAFYYFNGLGGTLSLTNGGSTDYRTRITCTVNAQGYPVLNYPSGAQDTFGFLFNTAADAKARYLLTQKQDPQGNPTYFMDNQHQRSGLPLHGHRCRHTLLQSLL